MNKLNFAMFVIGAAIGSVTAWLYLKKHYEKITQEEIDSVKAAFADRKPVLNLTKEKGEQDDNHNKADFTKLKPDLIKYAAKLQEEGYTNYTEHSNKNINEEKDKPMTDRPYVISPDEFGEYDDNYELISLTYYSDGILTDEDDEIVDNIGDTVGEDFADHFNEYEEDAIYIRNNRLKRDYEILKDNRSFKEVIGMNYYQEE